MGNLGGGEILVLILLGLLVIGPQRLPVVVRQVGRLLSEVRRMSRGFQEEFRAALEDPVIEAKARTRGARLQSGSMNPGNVFGPDSPEDRN